MEKKVQFSPQQQAFIKWAVDGSGSCVLEAVAGAGKTTTLLEAAQTMPGQVAILAYNKKIAEEIKQKLLDRKVDWKKAQAGTVHSFGFNAYRKTFSDCKVNERKVDLLIEQANDEVARVYAGTVKSLVSYAKQRALGVLGSIENDAAWFDIIEHFDLLETEDQADALGIIDVARKILLRSIDQTNVIDFDDMIYMALIHKVRFWQFDVVMVDEAQDTNPARRALVRALLKRGGRCIAVGDRHQAIYGFTGADGNSLDLIAADFNSIHLPLTVSYRCPQEVIRFAQQWVSHIEAAPTAPQGKVSAVKLEDFMKRDDLDGTAAVLCRNTKPLVVLAFALIRQGTACRVEGREIGNGLKRLAQRWKTKTVDALLKKLENYLEQQTVKLLAKKQEVKLQAVEDQVETLKVIIQRCIETGKTRTQDVVDAIDQLFDNDVSNMLVLSTIHKSKGREWPRVFWLDRQGTCPSKWARQEWQKEQEVNLQYVAATRAQEELIDLVL